MMKYKHKLSIHNKEQNKLNKQDNNTKINEKNNNKFDVTVVSTSSVKLFALKNAGLGPENS